jgi:hypothetical protein
MLDLSIAMVSCFRPDLPLSTAVRWLQDGGFQRPLRVFSDPRPQTTLADATISVNERKLGGWENWRQAATWLVEKTASRYLMLVEDDVEYCQGAYAAIASKIRACPDFSVLNLYFSERDYIDIGSNTLGWFCHNRGYEQHGTLALVFDRLGGIAEYLHDVRDVRQNGHRLVSYDKLLFQWLADHNKTNVWTHNPSLVDHVGFRSRLRHADHPGRRGHGFCAGFH